MISTRKKSLPIVSIFVGIRMRGGYCACDTTKDSRHTMQVVYAASVVGFRVLGQEWLRIKQV